MSKDFCYFWQEILNQNQVILLLYTILFTELHSTNNQCVNPIIFKSIIIFIINGIRARKNINIKLNIESIILDIVNAINHNKLIILRNIFLYLKSKYVFYICLLDFTRTNAFPLLLYLIKFINI